MPPSVLVAEDEPDIRTALVEYLAMEGYRVRAAVDGVEAFDLFTRELPDVVVSNISMPRMDGITLTHRIREGGHAVPVILISAEEATVELPGVVLIAKPFDLDDVVAAVKRSVEGP